MEYQVFYIQAFNQDIQIKHYSFLHSAVVVKIFMVFI